MHQLTAKHGYELGEAVALAQQSFLPPKSLDDSKTLDRDEFAEKMPELAMILAAIGGSDFFVDQNTISFSKVAEYMCRANQEPLPIRKFDKTVSLSDTAKNQDLDPYGRPWPDKEKLVPRTTTDCLASKWRLINATEGRSRVCTAGMRLPASPNVRGSKRSS